MFHQTAWVEHRNAGMPTAEIAANAGVEVWRIYAHFKSVGYRHPDVDKARPLTESQKTWIACVIDCEGTIHARQNVNKNGEVTQIAYGVRVEMTTNAIPLRLRELCGGNYFDYKEQKGNRKPHCMWTASPKVLRWLLPTIRDYFMVKQRHADIVIELLNGRRRGIRNPQFNATSNRLLKELTSLNFKGRRALINDLPDVICMVKV